uniref:Uncharacterized protein n=1 Tax=Rhizophora mucronata TaxID=61149 RepID=A0A2P2MY73_RHIMU
MTLIRNPCRHFVGQSDPKIWLHGRIHSMYSAGLTKRRPERVSKEAPTLLEPSYSGRQWMESLATAANACSRNPTIGRSPPSLDIVLSEGPSKLVEQQQQSNKHK